MRLESPEQAHVKNKSLEVEQLQDLPEKRNRVHVLEGSWVPASNID
jgi:hypothetical protein